MAEFDVFLSHSSKDKAAVRAVGEDLKARGVTVWLDEWELQPGKRWQRELEAAIAGSRSVAVFVGANGLGPWEEPEMEVFLDRAMRES
ncbi:MAG TPA: toll/interleukin-1 receptor domain-containing protein, partial [Thermoanaerobaculia bacterium]|nr:toll/interleukin-1 receptor domain-containing protein [Thermoanaerobaculia bacterium]